MVVKKKEEIMAAIKAILKDNTSDEALALVEDVSDTLDQTAKGEDVEAVRREMQQKYDELDKSWRTKYRERFFTQTSDDKPDIPEPKAGPEPETKQTFESLFEERKD